MFMKKVFSEPDIVISQFSVEDIITASSDLSGGGAWGDNETPIDPLG